jgi:hypothetical protein
LNVLVPPSGSHLERSTSGINYKHILPTLTMSASSPSPQPEHLRAALGDASTFRSITWNLSLPVQISLAVGPSVSGRSTTEEQVDGRGFSSDIGARGGVAAGLERYYVSFHSKSIPPNPAELSDIYTLPRSRCNAQDTPTSR